MAARRKKVAKPTATQKADQVARLYEAPIFQEALTFLEALALEAFRRSRSPEEAWYARLRQSAAAEFRAHLTTYLRDGREALEAELARQREQIDKVAPEEEFRAYLARAEAARKAHEERLSG